MFAPLVIKLFALFGLKMSNFWASLIVWGIVIAIGAGWYAHEINEAEERGRVACENKIKEVTRQEQERVDAANDLIQKKDDEIRTIQQRKSDEIRIAVADAIKKTEANSRICWDRDTIRNLNRVR